MTRALMGALAWLFVAARSEAQESPRRCDAPLPDSIVHVRAGGRPIDVLTDRTGCFVFVTVQRDSAPSGVLVLRRGAARFDSLTFVELAGNPFGMRLSPDGRRVYVAAGNNVAIVDLLLATGKRSRDAVISVIRDSSFAGAIMVNVTADNRFLFVSQERAAAITVVELEPMRPSGARVAGRIPTGNAPIAVEFSPDGKRLYATAQQAPPSLNWPIECRPQVNRTDPPDHRSGVVMVIDVERARRDPASSILSTVKAGCNPVRLVLSPNGSRAYVSARTDDQVLVFNTQRIANDPAALPIARVSVGTAPVGMAVIDHGERIVVTSSNRFSGSAADQQDLSVLRTPASTNATPTVAGRIPAGAFPRQLHLAPDGRTLYVTNFASGTLQVIDLSRVKPR